MNDITIWHNPRCSKSREALALAQGKQSDVKVFEYLNARPKAEELKTILKMLGFASAREWMRTKEAIYKELKLHEEHDEQKLLEAMAAHPKLIERPVIIKGEKAIIARPPTLLKEFLES